MFGALFFLGVAPGQGGSDALPGQILTEGTVAEIAADPRVKEVYLGKNSKIGAAHG